MASRVSTEAGAIRIVSAALESVVDSVLAERAGVRVLILRDTLTIREGMDHTSELVGRDIRRTNTGAHVA